MELTRMEKLAVLQAVQNLIKDELADTKGDVKDDMLEKLRKDGTEKVAVTIGGVKVGEVSVTWNSPKAVINPDKREEAMACLREMGLTEEVPVKGWEKHFRLKDDGTGIVSDQQEVVDWAEWQDKTPKTAAVRGCDWKDVNRAWVKAFGASPANLLLGGN